MTKKKPNAVTAQLQQDVTVAVTSFTNFVNENLPGCGIAFFLISPAANRPTVIIRFASNMPREVVVDILKDFIQRWESSPTPTKQPPRQRGQQKPKQKQRQKTKKQHT